MCFLSHLCAHADEYRRTGKVGSCDLNYYRTNIMELPQKCPIRP